MSTRLQRFRASKRGWWSFLLLCALFAASVASPLWVNHRALAVRHAGHYRFPVFEGYVAATELGQAGIGEARYRDLKAQYAREAEGDWVLLVAYPYGPDEGLLYDPLLEGPAPHPPSFAHWMGTDYHYRDLFARLVYGLRLSLGFGLGVLVCAYSFGVLVGAVLGYFGGWIDLLGQRLVEIWSGLPFLYTVLIVSALVRPTVVWLVALLAAFGWMGISAYVRAEVYRERAKPYALAAVAQGEGPASVLFRHVLPNAVVSVVSYAPFAMAAFITDLVQLDYLGFGLPDARSWGQLVGQGLENVREWHLVVFPLGAMFLTLLLVVFVGEGARDALDPRPPHRRR